MFDTTSQSVNFPVAGPGINTSITFPESFYKARYKLRETKRTPGDNVWTILIVYYQHLVMTDADGTVQEAGFKAVIQNVHDGSMFEEFLWDMLAIVNEKKCVTCHGPLSL